MRDSAPDRDFLERPLGRPAELRRTIRIFAEFRRGFAAMHDIGLCATVFGSSRFSDENVYYSLARDIGRRLAQAGLAVMTGGGPGIMEAANRGAQEGGGVSLGCSIDLPDEEPNRYVDRWIEFRYFFVRKVMLIKYSHAFVVLPGGFGTMDELFELATLIKTGKVARFPCVLVGTDYWRHLGDLLRGMAEAGTIDGLEDWPFDLTDDPAEAVALIAQSIST